MKKGKRRRRWKGRRTRKNRKKTVFCFTTSEVTV
jgi:hypothetical protein